MRCFKDNLKDMREAKGFTQDQLGRKSGMAGAVISFYETGARKPGLDNITALCKALECSADWLLGLEEE